MASTAARATMVAAAVGVTAALVAGTLPASATASATARTQVPTTSPVRAPAPAGPSSHSVSASEARALGTPAMPAGSSHAAVARAFAVQNARALGLRGELGASTATRSVAGGSVVRFPQQVGGVPVMGAEVVVDVSATGSVRGALSETLPGEAPATTPSITNAAAATTARALIARELKAPVSSLDAAPPTLTVYDPAILGAPGPGGAHLVWRTEVTSWTRADVRRLVLVDALRGTIALTFDQIDHAKSRTVCDANNVRDAGVPCTSPVRTEGGAVSAVPDVELAYDYAGRTYDFFATMFGRDSIDGQGMPIVSTVRYCESAPASACPYDNAFWDGSQMVYGAGFASADDVVAHELTHGVTERTSGLFYFFQSGAINESLSDVFGEFVDLTDGVGTDTAETRWQMGEDLPASVGVIRDMADPTLFGDPDRTDSPSFSTGVDSFGPVDGGAVHSNSGVGNKFAYLLADGDTFNEQTVTGVGITKAATIIYGASQLLTSAADYRTYAAALRQSCASLVGTADITNGDCTQVEAAILATAMDVIPAATLAQAVPPPCTGMAGTTNIVSFRDDFDGAAATRWARTSTESDTGWYYADEVNPYSSYGFVSKYATSGVNNLWGDDADYTASMSARFPTAVAVHAGSYLRFEHSWAFDQDPGGMYDGGVVEYSTTGPAGPWAQLGTTFAPNGYNGRILNYSGTTNVLKGKLGFVGSSRGYRTTRLNLAALADETVHFRFHLATDASIGSYGWFIDDVEVGNCGTAPSAPSTPNVSGAGGSIIVLFSAPDSGLDTTYTATCTSSDGGAPGSASASRDGRIEVAGLTNGRSYTCTVTAENELGETTSQPSDVASPVDTAAPTLTVRALPTVSFKAPVFTATGTDDTGVVRYLVSRRTATARTGFSAWSTPRYKNGATFTSPETFTAGTTVCLRIQSEDAVGKRSPEVVRCTTTPVDERSLTRSLGSAWTRSSTSAAYLATISTSKKLSDELSLTHARGTSLVLVVRKGVGAGTVSVWVGGVRVSTVKLSAATAAWRVQVPIARLVADRTVTIKVESAGTAGATIDGLAVIRK